MKEELKAAQEAAQDASSTRLPFIVRVLQAILAVTVNLVMRMFKVQPLTPGAQLQPLLHCSACIAQLFTRPLMHACTRNMSRRRRATRRMWHTSVC